MLFILTTLLLAVLNCVSSLKLDVASKQVHARIEQNITIMCKADSPLTECQFTWKNRWSVPGPLIDFKLGRDSLAGTSSFATSYSYAGDGLQQGDCGITLLVKRWASRIVGCRARTANEDWEYEYVVVTVDSHMGFPMTLSTNTIVAKVGDNVTILCTATQPLKDCIFSFPNNNLLRFNQGNESKRGNNTQYAGTGLENGQCGILIQDVTSAYNGWILCSAKTAEKKSLEVLATALILAQPPISVDLQVENNPVPVGDDLKATCTVPDSRPPANITWYFGSEMVRRDRKYNFPNNDEWAWIDSPRTVIQTIKQNVTGKDNGKDLRCTVDHIGLPNTILKSERISVSAPTSCMPLISKSMLILCVRNGNLVNCSDRVQPGTTAGLQCKYGYVPPQPHPGHTSVTCMDNGEWNKEIYDCVVDCGRRNTKGGETLLQGGYRAKIGEFPWHIAIYEKTGQNTFMHICGGSLITPEVLLSAAHCFWDNQLGVKKNHTLYKISAGKYWRDLNAEEDMEPQTREVMEIKLPERYKGIDSNYAPDIAQVRISSPLDITARVSTICIDWVNSMERFHFLPEVNGTVAGWGFTETGQQSDELDAVDLPFVPFGICWAAIPKLMKQLLTDDKFCAGYLNRSISVCRGDSGGGLVFYSLRTDRYYLRGIVSIAFKPPDNTDQCYAQLYTAFTKVSKYREWLQQPFH